MLSWMKRVTAVIAVSAALVSCDSEPEFTTELLPSDSGPEPVLLEDGGELAIRTDGRQTYVAQWRAPNGDLWTEPVTIVEGPGLQGAGSSVQRSGEIAAVSFGWYDEGDDEREYYAREDVAVCLDYRCEAVEDVDGEAMVSGEFVAVPAAKDSPDLNVWTAGGWDTLTVSGPPVSDQGFVHASDLDLLDDQTFVTVIGNNLAGLCSFELWQSEPRRATLKQVAATKPRLDRACAPELLETDGDVVRFYFRSIDQQVTFSRPGGNGSGWVNDLPENGPLQIESATGFAMKLSTLGVDGGTVAVGSPDGTEIVAQYRAINTTSWSEPVTVATAPDGQQCHSARPTTLLASPDVMYLVHCWPVGSDWGGRVRRHPAADVRDRTGQRRWSALVCGGADAASVRTIASAQRTAPPGSRRRPIVGVAARCQRA